jgi:hypothetical protein
MASLRPDHQFPCTLLRTKQLTCIIVTEGSILGGSGSMIL